MNSPGGAVEEALTIGRLVREKDIKTVILAGMFCVSACPYVLAGGVERSVSLDGAVGLHQHYYDASVLLPAIFAVKDIQMGQGRTMAYLIEMGIDPGVMLHSLRTPPDEIYVLNQGRARRQPAGNAPAGRQGMTGAPRRLLCQGVLPFLQRLGEPAGVVAIDALHLADPHG